MAEVGTGKRLFLMDPRRGEIVGKPTNSFGAGGNFIPDDRELGSTVIPSLRGKATQGSDIILKKRKRRKRSFVRFKGRPISGDNVRSELAAGTLFPFGKTLSMRIRLRARPRKPVTGTAYLLQFWQPVVSPIAGIRIQDGQLQVVTRSAGGALSRSFEPGRWYDLIIRFRAGHDGELTVFGGKSGRKLGQVRGTITAGSQADRTVQDAWRPKFGFYGSSDNDINVDVGWFEIAEG